MKPPHTTIAPAQNIYRGGFERGAGARALRTCIRCQGAKDEGLVVCWPCHGYMKATFGGCYDPEIEQRIKVLDALAEQAGYRPSLERVPDVLKGLPNRGSR
jgi:hypothetical protein